MVNTDFLKTVQIFQGLNQEQLDEIVDCCEEATYQPGVRIFEQGEEADYLWIVKAGRVDLRFESADNPSFAEHPISTISEAGAFGWSSFSSPNKYRLAAYCGDQPCTVIQVDRNRLKALLDKDAEMGYVVISNVATVVGTRFHEFQEEAAKQKGDNLLGGW